MFHVSHIKKKSFQDFVVNPVGQFGDKWVGRVQRRDSGHIEQMMMNVELKGGRPQGRFLDMMEEGRCDGGDGDR